jgi:hypothetical protein
MDHSNNWGKAYKISILPAHAAHHTQDHNIDDE